MKVIVYSMNKRLKELWFKLVAYSNEKGITEKLKVIWLKIWGKEPAEVDVSIFNDDERFHILNIFGMYSYR